MSVEADKYELMLQEMYEREAQLLSVTREGQMVSY